MNISIEFQIEKLNIIISIFENLLKPLNNLEINDKLCIDESENLKHNIEYKYIDLTKLNFTLHIDKYRFYMPISRWLHKQDRYRVFSKLDVLFNEYSKLLQLLRKIKVSYHYVYNKQLTRCNLLTKLIIKKLDILNKTYNNKLISNKIKKYLGDIFIIEIFFNEN